MRFYEACPVLTSNDDVKKHSAYLCRFAADTLCKGLELLGIDVRETR